MGQASRTRLLRLALAAAIGLWAAVVLGGTAALGRYTLTPGASAGTPARWPAQSSLSPPANRPVLLVFAHPRCPCTRATANELDRLLGKVGEPVDARMVFVLPEGTGEAFLGSELWMRAARIAGLQRLVDPAGREAARFGSLTSGQVLLYGTDGALLFQGGITVARGHEGESPGSERIRALLSHRTALGGAPVFGCELNDPVAQGETP
jgi:hypothetical protein